MIAPMLAGVVYLSVVKDFVQVLNDCNVKRVYFHSFWAKKDAETGSPYYDCHCLAGLTSFANAFKMVVNGGSHPSPDSKWLTANRSLAGKRFQDLWMSNKSGRIRLLVGQVMDDRPPVSAWVPIDDFLAGTVPSDYPVVCYTQVERASNGENNAS